MKIPKPESFTDSSFRLLIEAALAEDIGAGDRTTHAVLPEPVPSVGRIRAKEPFVVAGLWVVPEVFRQLDSPPRVDNFAHEGQYITEGSILAQLTGDGRSILTGERVALNFLQRLCGISTLTSRFVRAVEGYKAVILDTRKTTPGWRRLEKYAVRVGGGKNHRESLEAAILIKDNQSGAYPTATTSMLMSTAGAE